MKKLAGFVSTLVLTTAFSTTCAAMQFQQPVFIGSIASIYAGGPHTADRWKISREVIVRKDSLTMGKGSTAIVFKYKDTPSKYDNTKYRTITQMVSGNGKPFPVDNNIRYFNNTDGNLYPNHWIYQVNGENGVVAYVDIMHGIMSDTLRLRGLWKDGKPVTYVGNIDQFTSGVEDANLILKDKEMRLVNDTICIPYTLNSGGVATREIHVRDGEFRFKWDDKAYWFGIEDFVY